jgi:hypothetical protein
MRDWKKLSVPVLIFALVPFLILAGCQTTPSAGSPEVLTEIVTEQDDAACKHFQTPLFTLDELRALSTDAQRVLGVWDQLWVDYGCE